MDLYRKFMVDVIAVTTTMDETASSKKEGVVESDSRLFNDLVRIATKARKSMNHNLEFKLNEELRRVRKRFSIDDGLVSKPKTIKKSAAPKPYVKPSSSGKTS